MLVETRFVPILRSQFGRHCRTDGEPEHGLSRVRLGAPTPLDIARYLTGWGTTVEVVEPRSGQTELARGDRRRTHRPLRHRLRGRGLRAHRDAGRRPDGHARSRSARRSSPAAGLPRDCRWRAPSSRPQASRFGDRGHGDREVGAVEVVDDDGDEQHHRDEHANPGGLGGEQLRPDVSGEVVVWDMALTTPPRNRRRAARPDCAIDGLRRLVRRRSPH